MGGIIVVFVLQDSYQEPTMLQCKHIFCEDCVSTWFDRDTTCPMCRAKVFFSFLYVASRERGGREGGDWKLFRPYVSWRWGSSVAGPD